ncbi:MAG TPA: DinB family protein [Acidimicrobiales bacterium]|nr:DinB family protein [Acidimicrobiales bacterium]
MADRKPSRITGDDRETLLGLLQYQRESFARKLSGVGPDEAAASPVPSGTSLLWLANHMADAEVTWVLSRFAGRPPDPELGGRQGTVAEALGRYRRVGRAVDAVVRDADLDDRCPTFDSEGVVNLRWILAHLLQETARHAGHADILRELIDGATGR